MLSSCLIIRVAGKLTLIPIKNIVLKPLLLLRKYFIGQIYYIIVMYRTFLWTFQITLENITIHFHSFLGGNFQACKTFGWTEAISPYPMQHQTHDKNDYNQKQLYIPI